jgi:hypothetical protein
VSSTWNKPRRLALEVFFLRDGIAYRSRARSMDARTVGYAALDWLVGNGYVEPHARPLAPASVPHVWRLTAKGWRAGASLWSVPHGSLCRLMAAQPPKGAPL